MEIFLFLLLLMSFADQSFQKEIEYDERLDFIMDPLEREIRILGILIENLQSSFNQQNEYFKKSLEQQNEKQFEYFKRLLHQQNENFQNNLKQQNEELKEIFEQQNEKFQNNLKQQNEKFKLILEKECNNDSKQQNNDKNILKQQNEEVKEIFEQENENFKKNLKHQNKNVRNNSKQQTEELNESSKQQNSNFQISLEQEKENTNQETEEFKKISEQKYDDCQKTLEQQNKELKKLSEPKNKEFNRISQQKSNNCSLLKEYHRDCIEATACKPFQRIYTIQLDSIIKEPFPVVCGDGWMVIQSRQDGSIDFYRDWQSYKIGFGNLETEFFIGLDKLHALTTVNGPQELLIVMSDYEGETKYAKYDSFVIGNEEEFYALKELGEYSGDAGDPFTYHLGQKFSTKDKDNDRALWDCANTYKGAWWYDRCQSSNLNGLYLKGETEIYGTGVVWANWRGYYYSLKDVKMMIRPKTLRD